MVKCKFCLQQMSEVDMLSHVFYDHKISGIFSSVGGENVRKNDVTTSTVSIQTGENSILAPTKVLQREQEQERDEQERDHRGQGLGLGQGPCELRSNLIRETENSDTNNSYQEIDDAYEVENLENEEDLILIDDESDVEIDSKDDESDIEIESLPDINSEDLSECSTEQLKESAEGRLMSSQHQDSTEQERDHRGQGLGQGLGPCEQDKDHAEQGNDQLRSNSVRETENSDTNNSYQEIDDAFTLIKVAKSLPGTVKKKVTFSDMTNYYPISKRKRLKRGAREPLLLGANTTLKYLKYWGTTNKPDC